ncbi:MAG TPA: DUF5667 domain-containing protein, partial [Egibacteraceae bacterium]|nr:DUF5667 domain-containing protein [Egibacteraceae bacterium]
MSDDRDDLGGPDFADAAAALRAALGGEALSADARARHLYALREHAALLGPPRRARHARRVVPVGLVRRMAAAVAASGLLATLGSGVAVAASADSLPGEALYEVKLLTEGLRLALPESPAGEVTTRLRLAERRLEEAEELRRDAGPQLDERLAATILAYEELVTGAASAAGSDEGLQARVRSTVAVAEQRLVLLLAGGLPEQASVRARQALADARQRLGGPPPLGAPAGPQVPGHGPGARPEHPGAPEGAPEPPVPAEQPGPPQQVPAPSQQPGPPGEPGPPHEPGPPDEPG